VDLETFRKAFAELRAKGWIESVRRGDTGVGYTLERYLGLTESNIAVPDLGEVELKAHRVGSNSLITLFTFNRKVWQIRPIEAVRRYGAPDRDPAKAGRLGLYFTLSRTPNSSGLFLHVEEEFVALRHISGEEIAVWQLEALAARFKQKFPAMILVSAHSEMRGDKEYFIIALSSCKAHRLLSCAIKLSQATYWWIYACMKSKLMHATTGQAFVFEKTSCTCYFRKFATYERVVSIAAL
jgi:hypothetical protein